MVLNITVNYNKKNKKIKNNHFFAKKNEILSNFNLKVGISLAYIIL